MIDNNSLPFVVGSMQNKVAAPGQREMSQEGRQPPIPRAQLVPTSPRESERQRQLQLEEEQALRTSREDDALFSSKYAHAFSSNEFTCSQAVHT